MPGWVSRGMAGFARIDRGLIVVVAVATGLRLWRLGAQSLWFDEWLTTEAVSGSVPDVFRHVANREGIPPTYFGLMWLWTRLFGDGEAALRTVSALAGIATVPVTYAAARELGQRRAVARLAALLVAVSPLLVWYSQEARPYSLLALYGALSLLGLARALHHGERRDHLLFGVVSAAGIALHYFAGFLVAAELVALLALRRPSPRLVALSCIPSGVVLVLLVPVAWQQRSHDTNSNWISRFRFTDRLQDAGRSALEGPNPVASWLWIAMAVVVALSMVLLLTRASRQDRATGGLLFGVGGGSVLLAGLAAAGSMDVFLSRYLIAAYPALVVGTAVGLAAWAGWLRIVAAASGVTLSLATVVTVAAEPDLHKPDWGAVARVAQTGSDQRVLVLNVHRTMAQPLLHYYDIARPLADRERIEVDQIDVLVAQPTERPCSFLVGRACALVFLGGALPDPIASDFVLDERIELDQFTLDRYRAAEPVTVTKADVVRPADLPDALVLVP